MSEKFEVMLTGGHPNSLGRTVEVVEVVLANPKRFEELFNCYFSKDEVVRLRVSNALKRIAKEKIELIKPYTDRLLNEIADIDQASTQWTLAQLLEMLTPFLDLVQLQKSKVILKRNLVKSNDWIVINMTLQTLALWAKKDEELKIWLIPHLQKFEKDERKSIAGRAKKLLKVLS